MKRRDGFSIGFVLFSSERLTFFELGNALEVLSPSTEMRDRTEKLAQYQKCRTIEEYILVSQDRQVVEVYTRNGKKWVYQMFESGEEIELTSIDFHCPIEAFYEDVPWSTELQ